LRRSPLAMTLTRTEREMMSLRRELRTIRLLAAPVVATQLASVMLGVVDTLMLGHHSKEALAASAVGRVWVFGTLIVAQGLLLGLDPLISQAHGRGDKERLGTALQGGLCLTFLVSIPLAVMWLFTEDVLGALGVTEELRRLAGPYATAQIVGIPFYLGFHTLRSWLQGRGIMRPAMWIVLIANGFNVLANWALIYGHLGFDALGVKGAGYATALTQVFMLLGLVAFVRAFQLQRGAWCAWSVRAWHEAREVIRLGLPIGVQFGLEVWAFKIATLMCAELGTDEVAAHSIVLTLASLSFMVPLGVSIGTATRVGNLIGARQCATAQVASSAGILLGGAAMAVFALLFVAGRGVLPRLFTDEPGVVLIAAAVLPIAAAFQLFDGVQVVASGVLRGMGRTRILAIVHLIAFYLLGLPLAWYLGFEQGLGVEGIWWGLASGLGVVALMLVVWVLRRGPATMEAS
jgi:MATE family multidrug resistance protein